MDRRGRKMEKRSSKAAKRSRRQPPAASLDYSPVPSGEGSPVSDSAVAGSSFARDSTHCPSPTPVVVDPSSDVSRPCRRPPSRTFSIAGSSSASTPASSPSRGNVATPIEDRGALDDILDGESDLESVADYLDLSWSASSDSEFSEKDEESIGDSPQAGTPTVSSVPLPSHSHSASPSQSDVDDPVAPQPQPPTCHPDPPQNRPYLPFTSTREFLLRPNGTDQLDFFRLLLTDDILDVMVEETNVYASGLQANATPGARINRWKPLTRNELLVFIGLLFHTGTIQVPTLAEYWSQDNYFGGMMRVDFFPRNMQRDRFLLILKSLHFARNPTDGRQTDDRLYKIRPLINHFNSRLDQVYAPSRDLSVDESVVLWRGRLAVRQFIRGKRHKYGIKLYMLAELSGLPLKFLVYSGAGDRDVGGACHTERVVKRMIDKKTSQGHCLNMDNSVELAADLLKKETHCTGTLRKNRRHDPTDVTSARLERGEVVQRYTTDGVCVLKWKDKREVFLISTDSTGVLVDSINRRGQVLQKPEAVVKYNQSMCGVDRVDQLMSYYPCERKTLKWYKKLGIHIFQLLLLASFHFFNIDRRQKQPLHVYRLHLIQQLTKLDYDYRPELLQPQKKLAEGRHFPDLLCLKSSGKRKQVNCRRRGCKKKTSYFCKGCPPYKGKPIGLCVTCFEGHHL